MAEASSFDPQNMPHPIQNSCVYPLIKPLIMQAYNFTNPQLKELGNIIILFCPVSKLTIVNWHHHPKLQLIRTTFQMFRSISTEKKQTEILNIPWSLTEIEGNSLNAQKVISHIIKILNTIRSVKKCICQNYYNTKKGLM